MLGAFFVMYLFRRDCSLEEQGERALEGEMKVVFLSSSQLANGKQKQQAAKILTKETS